MTPSSRSASISLVSGLVVIGACAGGGSVTPDGSGGSAAPGAGGTTTTTGSGGSRATGGSP
ncbi:MAG TPA: hypothetical protein VHM31_06920, partial [Polyangia bacterium]|nr:hypothetical protein [Polyangia bacterium]